MPQTITREGCIRPARFCVPNCLPLVPLLAASLASAAGPLPIEYFTRDDDFGLLKVSPDGEYIAATATVSDYSALVFIELDGMEYKGGIRARTDDEITGFDWASDTRVIYHYGERIRGREYISRTGEIYAVDRDGARHRILYGYRASNQRIGSRLGNRESTNASGELLSVLENDDDDILILERPWEVRVKRCTSMPTRPRELLCSTSTAATPAREASFRSSWRR